MKYPRNGRNGTIGTAFAAIVTTAILGGSALFSPAAIADNSKTGASLATETAISASRARELQRELKERAQKDAEAMASDALRAASELDLDIAPAGLTSVLMASEF